MRRRVLSTLIVGAHPDDEVLAAGIWISRQRSTPIHILHITDGSPRDMLDARGLGFPNRRSYAAARRRELAAALSLVEIPPANCSQFNIADKEACLNLPELIQRLDELITRLEPDRVLSPCYEGGHPDHDAAAFAVAMVGKRQKLRKRQRSFVHWEFPLYHAGPKGKMITGNFIPGPIPRRETIISPTPEERSLKARMLSCFVTQKEILSRFKVDFEHFRRAVRYDFTQPPHPRPLLYERWGWGISGAVWRDRAIKALSL